MSREIIFKGWLAHSKKMTYPHTLDELMNWNTKPEDNGSALWLQYTGIKDKNGKEIFEGDILGFWTDCSNDYDMTVGNAMYNKSEVKYQGSAFVIIDNDLAHDWIPLDYWLSESADDAQLEVLGNIYENPGLLQ